jgi:uncharacterized protein YecT (DUF1311 family)
MKQNLLIVLLAIPFALYSEIAHAGPCETQNDNGEMIQCANLLYEEADDELNAVWQALSNRTRNKLRPSQRNWIKDRDTVCTQEADETAGTGTMWPIIFIGCKTTETEKRTEFLEKFLD